MEKQPGKKHKDELKEKAFALLVSNNASYVAKELGLPYSTVKTWENNFLGKGRAKAKQKPPLEKPSSETEDKNNEDSYEDDLAKLRKKKREEFVTSAWELIEDSLAVAKKRMSRARNLEHNIDIVAEALKKNAGKIEAETGVGWFALLDLVKELQAIKNPKLSEISTLIGTIYDKQALANGEATSREETVIKGFEDY